MSSEEEMPGLEEGSNSSVATTSAPPAAPSAVSSSTRETPVNACHVGQDDDDVDDDDDDNDDGWEEMDGNGDAVTPALCLFCPRQMPVSEVLPHIGHDHGLDVPSLVSSLRLDCFGYIRLVNYVRTNAVSVPELRRLSAAAWADHKFMKPAVDSDPLLMIDIEDLVASPAVSADQETRCDPGHLVSYDGDLVTLSLVHYERLQRQLAALSRQLQASEERSGQLIKDMATMRGTMHQILRLDEDEPQRPPAAANAAGPAGDSESYFESYAHHGIHHEMLSDSVRTEAYRDAIVRNGASVMRGRRVLDVGCGTGILSMMSARAGAAHVTAVDMSDVIYSAMDIVRENGMENTISLVKGRLEDVSLGDTPDAKFDVIISEWMGYFLLFEGMLDSVLYARDRLLADGGVLIPNRCTMSLCAVSDTERYGRLVDFWLDVYDFKMTCLRGEVLQEASVEVVPGDNVCSDHCQIKDIDISIVTVADTEFTSRFSLTMTRPGPVTAIVGYFDTMFELPEPVRFSTGPHAPPTHWKQTVFYMQQPLHLQTGETLDGTLFCARDHKDVRALRVTITTRGKSQSYRVS